MIQFDASTKIITLSGSATFAWADIYNAAKEWDDEETSMGQHHPLDASAELLFSLRYGWVLEPSGYTAGDTVTVTGKISTLPLGAAKTTPATVGDEVTWQFDVPATAIIVTTGGSALTTEEHDKLMELKNASLLVGKKIL